MADCINDNLNIITHLKPVAIPAACEELTMEAAPEVTMAVLSTKPCPSEESYETHGYKHRPKPNSPATMILHRVKRKKKSLE
jgi:hypothetical protein